MRTFLSAPHPGAHYGGSCPRLSRAHSEVPVREFLGTILGPSRNISLAVSQADQPCIEPDAGHHQAYITIKHGTTCRMGDSWVSHACLEASTITGLGWHWAISCL